MVEEEKRVSIFVDEEFRDRLKVAAENDNRTMKGLLEFLLKSFEIHQNETRKK